ncbi:MAG TPA: hypothetical protein V6C65_05575 [Allocoleopsis sp.]
METVDVIVIGSGQGSIPLAVDFAKAGRSVVLFEQSVHIHPTYGEALPSLARLLLGDDLPGCPNM